MKPLKIRAGGANGPEARIHAAIEVYLRQRGWLVKSTHGNAFQQGFPDVFSTHPVHGQRWIEVKRKLGSSFTGAQIAEYPLFLSHGCPIWVMTAATHEEYEKLFQPCNVIEYLRASISSEH